MRTNYNYTTESKFVQKNKKKIINQWLVNLQEELSTKNHSYQDINHAFSSAILYCLLKQGESNFKKRMNSLIKQIEMHLEKFSFLSSRLDKLLNKLKYFGATIKKIDIKEIDTNISNTLENFSIVKRYLYKISNICLQSSTHVDELLRFTQTISDCLANMPAINSSIEYQRIFNEYKKNFKNINNSNEQFIIDFLKAYNNIQVIERNAQDISDLSENMGKLLNKISKCADKKSKKIQSTCTLIKDLIEEIKSEANLIEELIEANSSFSTKLLSSLNWNF